MERREEDTSANNQIDHEDTFHCVGPSTQIELTPVTRCTGFQAVGQLTQ